jgi:hypothetical protein
MAQSAAVLSNGFPSTVRFAPETLPRRTIKHAGDTATKFD